MASETIFDLEKAKTCPRAGDGFGRPGDWTRTVFSDELFTCPLCGLTFPMTAGVTRHPSSAQIVALGQAAKEAGWSSLAEGRTRGYRAVGAVRGRAIEIVSAAGKKDGGRGQC